MILTSKAHATPGNMTASTGDDLQTARLFRCFLNIAERPAASPSHGKNLGVEASMTSEFL